MYWLLSYPAEYLGEKRFPVHSYIFYIQTYFLADVCEMYLHFSYVGNVMCTKCIFASLTMEEKG